LPAAGRYPIYSRAADEVVNRLAEG